MERDDIGSRDNNEENVKREELKILEGEEKSTPPEKHVENPISHEIPYNHPLSIERRKKVIHIQRYMHSSFGEYIKCLNIDKVPLESMSNEDLDKLLSDIQLTIALKNSNKFNNDIFYGGVQMIEPVVSNFTPWNVNGLSGLLRSNPETNELLEEINLQYNKYISPEYRLCYSLISSMVSMDRINKNNELLRQEGKKPVSKEVLEKYNDL